MADIETWSGPSDRPGDYPTTLEEMNERYIFTSDGGKPVVYDVIEDKFIALETHRANFANVFVQHGERQVPLGTEWLRWPQRRSYLGGVVFAPGTVTQGKLNLWEGLAVKPGDGSCALFEAHLLSVICDGDETAYNWLLDHMAWGVQNLDRRQQVAVAFRGLEGAGKGTVFDWLEAIYGTKYTVRLSKPEDVVGRFSGHLVRINLVLFDEAFWAGKVSMVGRLKALVTENRLSSERKHKDVEMVTVYFRMYLSTNEEWAVPVTRDNRRFTVFDVSGAKVHDRSYFDAIREELGNGGPSALLAKLLGRDLSGFDELRPLVNAGMHRQVLQSLQSVEQYLLDVLYSGAFHNTPTPSNWSKATIEVETSELHRDYAAWCNDGKIFGKRYSVAGLGMQLSKLGISKYKGSSAKNMRVLPPLDEMRELLARHITKGACNWDALITAYDPEGVKEYGDVVSLAPSRISKMT